MPDPTAAPAKSEATRARIVAAARAVFAREGYERATVRLVAAEANIHASMITRYFGSKENLFATAAHIDLRLPDLGKADPKVVGARLAAHFVDRWEGQGEDGQLPALLRASVSRDAARARLIDIFDTQVLRMVQSIAGIERPQERAALIAAQLLGLAFGRYVARLPALVALHPNTITASLGDTIQAYLDRPLSAER